MLTISENNFDIFGLTPDILENKDSFTKVQNKYILRNARDT